MQLTVDLDEELLARASEVTGLQDLPTLLNGALRALIAREAARSLIALGGSDPDATAASRRRPPNFINEESDYPSS